LRYAPGLIEWSLLVSTTMPGSIKREALSVAWPAAVPAGLERPKRGAGARQRAAG